MYHTPMLFALVLALFGSQILAIPYWGSRDGVVQSLSRRTDPVFPDQPPSCPICEQASPSPSWLGILPLIYSSPYRIIPVLTVVLLPPLY